MTSNPLLTALRQYRHNQGEGFVFGYDKAETDRIVMGLVEALEEIAAFQTKDILCGSGWKEWNRAGEYAASIARSALATHRKQGGE